MDLSKICLCVKIGGTYFHIPKYSFFKVERSKIFEFEKAIVLIKSKQKARNQIAGFHEKNRQSKSMVINSPECHSDSSRKQSGRLFADRSIIYFPRNWAS